MAFWAHRHMGCDSCAYIGGLIYIQQSAMDGRSAAAADSERKSAKYSNLSSCHVFYPVAVETLGILADEAHEFITEIGRRASQCTADRHETTFLYNYAKHDYGSVYCASRL